MRPVILAVVLFTPVLACAEPVRDVPYFISHPAEASATRQACRANAAYEHLPTCRNAERAATNDLASIHRQGARESASMLYSEDYWTRNPIARAGVLEQCRRNGPGDAMVLPYCKVASASALHDLARH